MNEYECRYFWEGKPASWFDGFDESLWQTVRPEWHVTPTASYIDKDGSWFLEFNKEDIERISDLFNGRK